MASAGSIFTLDLVGLARPSSASSAVGVVGWRPCSLDSGAHCSKDESGSHGREGRKGSLSVNEFKELATQQLPHLLKDVGSLDEKMKSLDVNQDSELKFNEYWRLIGELAKEMRKEKAQEIRKK
ncbi:protein S100-A13 isoform X2 [Urocitellus parryii]|uniref:protein S100-A13 isoform X2 n=1 Tax=Urocitellus parryii TaxID=9999 RepID=UPI000E55CB48|nr:protein S100-A13 isoform X2 [Urocitellus parryii]